MKQGARTHSMKQISKANIIIALAFVVTCVSAAAACYLIDINHEMDKHEQAAKTPYAQTTKSGGVR